MEGGLRLGLGTRISLIVVGLILLAVAVGGAFAARMAQGIARSAAEEDLGSMADLQDSFRDQLYEQRRLAAYLFVADPYLAAYLAEATEAADTASVLDLLAERQADLGYDFAIVLDAEGRVVARTDRPGQVGSDLSDEPLVAAAAADYEAVGIWAEGGALYRAVAVPIAKGPRLYGTLALGFVLSDAAAAELKRLSGTDVVFTLRVEGGRISIVGGTIDLELEERLGRSLAKVGLDDPVELDLEADGRRWIASSRPLRDPSDAVVGSTVALAPLAPRLAPFRQIARVLALAGGVALLVAFALTFVLVRRLLRPMRELVGAASAARKGDYDRRIRSRRRDEVGELTRALDDLLSDLREKRDMKEYLTAVSASLPVPSPVVGRTTSGLPRARRGAATLLLVELRSHARERDEASRVLDAYSEDLQRLARFAEARRGELLAIAGHRAWLQFTGGDRSTRAFLTAAELSRSFVAEGRSLEAPAMAVAAGDLVLGPVSWGDASRPTFLGSPALRLEALVREASPGDVILSPEVEEELRSILEGQKTRPVPQKALFSGGEIFVVDSSQAAALASDHRLPTGGDPTASPTAPKGTTGSPELGPGTVVGGRFEILAQLGSGGMGVVYQAYDRELDEVVALKMLRREKVADFSTAASRLRDELRLARKITHPNVVRTYDLGEVDRRPFISMEYVRGVTLETLLDEPGRLAYSAALSIARQLCEGLAAAHAEGVLHRDIKPANLILEGNGNVKLMDFGIARPLRRLEPGQTVEGWVVGTPKYLAPEQLRGREPDARADIYACGVLLYEMFTGASPFEGSHEMTLVTQTLEKAPPAPSEHWPEIPPELEKILLRCLEKAPADRFGGAAELLEALSRLRA